MPANPGQKRNQEKAKKKRDAAQKLAAKQRARVAALAPKVDDGPMEPEDDGSPFNMRGEGVVDFDELDQLSEKAKVALKKKEIAEAAKLSAEMVKKFPNEPDGWQRFAGVWEARGDVKKALAEMERAAARVSKDDDVSTATLEKELVRLRAAVAKLG